MCYEIRRAEACVDWSTHRALGPVEEPGTLSQGAPVFPGSFRLGIEPKTLGGWCKTEPPAHQGSGAHQARSRIHAPHARERGVGGERGV
jgi:hypothetical protein